MPYAVAHVITNFLVSWIVSPLSVVTCFFVGPVLQYLFITTAAHLNLLVGRKLLYVLALFENLCYNLPYMVRGFQPF